MRIRTFALSLFLLVSTAAHADGGHVLLQQDSGSFALTLFAASEPITTGDVDFSVLVQDRMTHEVILNSSIDLTLISPGGISQTVHLTHENASNKLLQAGHVSVPEPGQWHGSLEVNDGQRRVTFPIAFDVTPGHSRRGIVIALLILPILVIAFFLTSQIRRERKTAGLKDQATRA
jgi:hypothetical protein